MSFNIKKAFPTVRCILTVLKSMFNSYANDLTPITTISSLSSSLAYDSSKDPLQTPTSIGPIWTFRPPRRHHHHTLALAKYAKTDCSENRVWVISRQEQAFELIWNLKSILSTAILCVLSWGNLSRTQGNNIDLSMFEMLKSITSVVSLFENSRSIIPPCFQTEG